MKKPVQLSAKLVSEFAKTRAELAALKKKENDMCEQIKDAMELEEIKEYAPVGCPFKLQLVPSERTNISWKDVAANYAKSLFGKKWKKFIDREIKDAGTSEVRTLLVQPNEKV